MQWVVPEKIHIPPRRMGFWRGEGVKDSGNPGRSGAEQKKKISRGVTSVKKMCARLHHNLTAHFEIGIQIICLD